MGKLFLFLDVFRKGSAVTDPKVLDDKTALTLALAALIWALNGVARSYGYDTGFTESDAANIAGTLAIVIGLFRHVAANKHVGILPAKETESGTSGEGEPVNNLQTSNQPNHQAEADLRGGP